MNGIEIKIDKLGRLVIPIKYRKKLGISANDKLIISLNNSSLIVSPVSKCCAICGSKLTGFKNVKLCSTCISLVKSEE